MSDSEKLKQGLVDLTPRVHGIALTVANECVTTVETVIPNVLGSLRRMAKNGVPDGWNGVAKVVSSGLLLGVGVGCILMLMAIEEHVDV